MRSFTIRENDAGQRMDKFITKAVPLLPKSLMYKYLRLKRIKLNGKRCEISTRLTAGDVVEMYIGDEFFDTAPEESFRFAGPMVPIVYEDEHLLGVNKPKGMVVHPAPGHYEDTLVNAVLYHCRDNLSGINGVLRPGIVHRIDKDTTGALIVCKNDKAHQKIADQLRAHTITRSYRAIVYNNFSEDEGMINAPIGRHPTNRKKRMVTEKNSKEAITHYKVLDHLNHKFNYIECRLETGRTHQIRVHMSHIGHPLLGDEVYGPANSKFKNLQGQTLHAATLGFIHPTTEEYMEFSAPLPDYFEKLLKTLA